MQLSHNMVLIVIAGFIAGCGGDGNLQQLNDNHSEPVKSSEPCTYTVVDSAIHCFWTAYKHSGKIAVHGTMDAMTTKGGIAGSTPLEAVQQLRISVASKSVNSKDPVRDQKLKDVYFGGMENTEEIRGSIATFQGSPSYGKCLFKLTMNGVEREVEGKYTVDEGTVQVRFTIIPEDWNTKAAVAALGEACAEKHTGEDGKTVFWPDVAVLVEAVLSKNCPGSR